MARKLREESHLPADGWSHDWVRAIVPAPKEIDSRYYEKRGDHQEGVMCKNIRTTLPDEMKQCGIYEWQTRGNGSDERAVVYVGSTCRDKAGALRARILEYCNDGSHKTTRINGALRRGYELWVRVKPSGRSRVAAENMENELLEEYDYAWNKRNNGKMREILN